MNVYVVLSNVKGNYEIERFEEEKWAAVRQTINPERIQYVTADLNDAELEQYDFKQIIWGRIFNPQLKNYKKIKVTLSKNISEMENEYNIKFEETRKDIEAEIEQIKITREEKRHSEEYKQKYDKWQESLEETRNLIPEDMDEYSAITEWKKMDCIMPPPAKIKDIKNSYKMSWTEFKEFVQKL